jgi:predicted permease
MHNLMKDLRYGLRMLLRRPLFTTVALIALALGIGANTAIFSVVRGVLLRSLPFERADRVVAIWKKNVRENEDWIRFQALEFIECRNNNDVFDQVAAYDPNGFSLVAGSEPTYVDGMRATANIFSLLRVKPVLGRTFLPGEDSAGHGGVVVLGYDLWRRQFNSSPDIVGQQISLYMAPRLTTTGPPATDMTGSTFTVIGVLPSDLDIPEFKADLWVPIVFDSSNLDRNQRVYLSTVGRLRDSVSLSTASAQMNVFARELEQKFPDTNKGWDVYIVPMPEELLGNISKTLLILFASVVLVLLIACVNVANLMLARASDRTKEISLRLALGATRRRLIRQLLTESILLSVLGGVLGLLLAEFGTRALVSHSSASIPRIKEVGIDGVVLAVTLLISILTGVIFGLVPALQTTKPDLSEALKEGARSSTGGVASWRFRGALVVSEVSLALVLLIGAALIAKSFLQLQGTDQGYISNNVMTAEISLPYSRYPEPLKRVAFYRDLLERGSALPSVESAGVANLIPTEFGDQRGIVTLEGQQDTPSGDLPRLAARTVSPGFFKAMGIKLLAGREFTDSDICCGPTNSNLQVMINKAMAQRYWPNEDPVGKQIAIGLPPRRGPFAPIIGVVADVRHWVDAPAEPTFYLPNLQQQSMTIALRSYTDPSRLARPLRETVRSIDPTLPVHGLLTMDQRLAEASPVSQARFRTLLLLVFALTALTLAAIGIYGVISYFVKQQTREIGIKMALGAGPGHVLREIVRRGMLLTLIGALVGLVGAFAATRLISSLLYGVSTTDPVVFAAAPFLLELVAFLAIYIPASRATRVEPLIALRYE